MLVGGDDPAVEIGVGIDVVIVVSRGPRPSGARPGRLEHAQVTQVLQPEGPSLPDHGGDPVEIAVLRTCARPPPCKSGKPLVLGSLGCATTSLDGQQAFRSVPVVKRADWEQYPQSWNSRRS